MQFPFVHAQDVGGGTCDNRKAIFLSGGLTTQSFGRILCPRFRTCEPTKSAQPMTVFPQAGLADWQKLAASELKGKPADSLTWATPEGIPVKPLYTAADLEQMQQHQTMPGLAA
jgi:hypothetical protein